MKSSKNATSIIEAMVVMLIVVSGIVGMYLVFNKSQQLSNTTANKIQAIQIAREGIEAVKNIRDTNWILFGSDTKNCWNVLNYDSSCVGAVNPNTQTYDINPSATDGFRAYQHTNNRWFLSQTGSSNDFSDPIYRNDFLVGLDSNGFYTQSGATSELKPIFTREINFNYIDTDSVGGANSNDEKVEVTSLVQWADSSSSKTHKVEFTTIITNWKK